MSIQKENKQVHVASVVRHGDAIVVPEQMPLPAAVTVLQRQIEYENEVVKFNYTIPVFVWDGAIALRKAMEKMFGFAFATAEKSIFGDMPPQSISVEDGYNSTTQVPWGTFALPTLGSGAKVKTEFNFDADGVMVFSFTGTVQRKFEPTLIALAKLTKEYAKNESIYKSKAFRVRFTDTNGQPIGIPEVKFMDSMSVKLNELVYSKNVERLIESNVWTPLKHTEAAKRMGVPLKRGVLLAGPYGTGKTLLAHATARIANENGWTFIYINKVSELPRALLFARQYGPAVIFAEDIDRTVSGERDFSMDQILNTLDGVDTKQSDVMTILTTNHLDKINRAILRPGRLDVVLNVLPPDAEAVERLIRVYTKDTLSKDEVLTEVGIALAGKIPAVIREVVERAKLEYITRTQGKVEGLVQLIAEDILHSAHTMNQQLDLLDKNSPDTTDPMKLVGKVVGDTVGAYILAGVQVAAQELAGQREPITEHD